MGEKLKTLIGDYLLIDLNKEKQEGLDKKYTKSKGGIIISEQDAKIDNEFFTGVIYALGNQVDAEKGLKVNQKVAIHKLAQLQPYTFDNKELHRIHPREVIAVVE